MAYSILSLDGGGSWAVIQARILEEKYTGEAKGHDILKKFDLVIANSGGSLVLALLCANKSLQEIIDTFNVDILKSIFLEKPFGGVPVIKNYIPRFDTENKLKVFKENLLNEGIDYGNKLLTELPALIGKPELQIVITNFDYDRERAVYWRSNRESKMEGSYIENTIDPGSAKDEFKTVKLAEAIHGASNAPVLFFDDPAAFPLTIVQSDDSRSLTKDHLFWDGAVGGNNNPVKAGVLEALANGDRARLRKEIRIVSIGTANTVTPVLYKNIGECEPQFEWLCRSSKIDGFFGDLSRMANAVIADPPDSASFEAHQILDLEYKQDDERFIRINPLVKPILKKNDYGKDQWFIPGKDRAWSEEEMKQLFTMDMAVTNQEDLDLIHRLCDDFFADTFDNQGIRIGGNKMDAILGHKKYSAAKRDWDKWDAQQPLNA